MTRVIMYCCGLAQALDYTYMLVTHLLMCFHGL